MKGGLVAQKDALKGDDCSSDVISAVMTFGLKVTCFA
jgi:hypothetical protein